MGDKSKIEWTDASWTPIRARYMEIQNDGSGKERIGWHCEHVSPGCQRCYAGSLNMRLGTGVEFKPGNLFREEHVGYNNGEVKVFLDEAMLLAPLRWQKPRMIFVCSMTDLFASFVPDEWIDKVFAVMALAPQHTFQVLTKRSRRMREYVEADRFGEIMEIAAEFEDGPQAVEWPLPNCWLGVSAEDQARADERIPDLLATPAAVRFVSAEPLLSPVDLSRFLHDRRREGVPSASRSGMVHREARRDDMAERELSRRGSFASDMARAEEGRTQHFEEGWLSPDHVQRSGGAEESLRASDRVDDLQSQGYPIVDGDQPRAQGWEQTAQHSGEPDSRHESAERRARLPSPEEEVQSSERRGERNGESDRAPGGGDQSAGQVEIASAARNRENVWADTGRGIGDCYREELASLNWTIVGGESGPGARPMVLGWAKNIIRQCQAAGVAAYMKQLGARPTNREGEAHKISDRKGANMDEWPEELRVRQFPKVKQ